MIKNFTEKKQSKGAKKYSQSGSSAITNNKIKSCDNMANDNVQKFDSILAKNFTKNDDCFVCQNCGKKVEKLKYSSRDHCNYCLCSLHVDINPGDRQNTCKGLLVPFEINYTQNKGYIIKYKCQRCKKTHNNKVAEDDDKKTILSVMNYTYDHKKYK